MRSCALRILLAATISIARVIFCVFCTLLILVRISLAPAMCRSLGSFSAVSTILDFDYQAWFALKSSTASLNCFSTPSSHFGSALT